MPCYLLGLLLKKLKIFNMNLALNKRNIYVVKIKKVNIVKILGCEGFNVCTMF